jgi:hypothetical protein
MSEITLDLRAVDKPRAYAELDGHVRAVPKASTIRSRRCRP